MTSTEQRIAEWTAASRTNAGGLTPAQAFEQSVRDLRHAGFRLPPEVAAGVRAALAEG